MNGLGIRTFLGANTPEGFFSYYEPFIENKRAYVIKGGPGTGKSSLMKKVAGEMLKKEIFTEYAYCSSDPDSLDGVLFPQLGAVLVDGTPPHTLEPPVPGALGGIINIGEYWDEKKLQRSLKEIFMLQGRIKKCFERCYHYLGAAGKIYADISGSAKDCIDEEKADGFMAGFMKRNFPHAGGGNGKIHRRFLSGYTPKGYITFKDTIYTLCDKVFVFRDDFFTSPYFMKKAAAYLDQAGIDFYAFYSPTSPNEIEHIAVPSFSTALVTSEKGCDFEPSLTRKIHLKRFLREDFTFIRDRLLFSKKIYAACINEALESLKKEKALHDDLEEIYIEAMDFSKLGKVSERLCRAIV